MNGQQQVVIVRNEVDDFDNATLLAALVLVESDQKVPALLAAGCGIDTATYRYLTDSPHAVRDTIVKILPSVEPATLVQNGTTAGGAGVTLTFTPAAGNAWLQRVFGLELTMSWNQAISSSPFTITVTWSSPFGTAMTNAITTTPGRTVSTGGRIRILFLPGFNSENERYYVPAAFRPLLAAGAAPLDAALPIVCAIGGTPPDGITCNSVLLTRSQQQVQEVYNRYLAVRDGVLAGALARMAGAASE
jgi:hypothetical protein